MKSLILILVIFTIVSGLLPAEVFLFGYRKGESYRVLSQVDEQVYVNGIFSHRSDILNRISIHVRAVDGSSGQMVAKFQTSERAYGSESVYELSEDYESIFWRDESGYYDIAPEFFMPVVRNVPLFPERDIKEGETWSAPGEEVHDLRRNFGIPEAFHFPILVSYEYVGKKELDDLELDHILISYTIFFRSPPIPDASFYPTRISGTSTQHLYWDSERGRPYYYNEEFDFRFDLSTGDAVEYIGIAEAKIIESTYMPKEDVAEEIRRALEEQNVEDAEVEVTDEGVTLILEDIRFLPDSAVLMSSEIVKLQIIASIIEDHPERDLLITGHTALAGTAEGRQRLSEDRAKVVGDYLLALGAKREDQIVTRGMGAREPIADQNSEEGRRRNRRVEITILEN